MIKFIKSCKCSSPSVRPSYTIKEHREEDRTVFTVTWHSGLVCEMCYAPWVVVDRETFEQARIDANTK